MLSNVSIWQLLIVLVIVIAIFGTKKLKTIGSDVGSAVKGFRKGMEDDSEPEQLSADEMPVNTVESSEKENDPAVRPPGNDV